jgi:hypothetical protein
MDEVWYSSNYGDNDCDERRLERFQLEIIVVKIVGSSSPRHGSFADRRRSSLQQTGQWPDAFKMGEMNDLGFSSRHVMGETSIVSNVTFVVVTDAVHPTWQSSDFGRQIHAVCKWIARVTAIRDHSSSTWRTTDWALADRRWIQGSLTLDNLTLQKYCLRIQFIPPRKTTFLHYHDQLVNDDCRNTPSSFRVMYEATTHVQEANYKISNVKAGGIYI